MNIFTFLTDPRFLAFLHQFYRFVGFAGVWILVGLGIGAMRSRRYFITHVNEITRDELTARDERIDTLTAENGRLRTLVKAYRDNHQQLAATILSPSIEEDVL